MAVIGLTDKQSHTDFFHRRIVVNVKYWRSYVQDKSTDVTALDDERELIIKAIAFALDLTETWPLVYDLLTSFAPYMERRGHWEIWKQILDRALGVSQLVEDAAGAITLSVFFARLLQRQNQLPQAVRHYRRVMRLARQNNNLYEKARACTNLGYLYVEEGYWFRAEILCCHALTVFESINSDHGRAHTENHLGFLYTRQGVWNKAREHLERACTIWQSMGDNHGLMRGFINLGVLYNEMGRLDKAIAALENALHYAQLAGEEAEIGKIYLNIGAAHQMNGEPVQAELYAWQAEAIFRRYSHSADLALAWLNLGRVYTDLARWDEANKYLKAALESCRQLNYEYGEIKVLIGRIEYELARENQSQAVMGLNQLEGLVQAPDRATRYCYLQPVLKKYRHSLTGS